MERASRYPTQCDDYDWVDKSLAKYEKEEGPYKSPAPMHFNISTLPDNLLAERAAELLQYRYEMLYQKESTTTVTGKKTIRFQARPLPTIGCPIICPRERLAELPTYYAVVERLFKETIEGDGIRSPWGMRSQFRLDDDQQMGFLMGRAHLFLGSSTPKYLTIDTSLPLKEVAMTLLRLLYDLAPQEETMNLSIPPTAPDEGEVTKAMEKGSLEFALRREFPFLWSRNRLLKADANGMTATTDEANGKAVTLSIVLSSSSTTSSTLQVPARYAAAARKALRNLSISTSPYRVPKKLSGRLLTLSIISLLPEGMNVIYDPISHTVTLLRAGPKHSLPSKGEKTWQKVKNTKTG